jgi:hypothetical protein
MINRHNRSVKKCVNYNKPVGVNVYMSVMLKIG